MSDLLTTREVAAILRCNQSTIRQWIKIGILSAIELPHTGPQSHIFYRIHKSVIDRILASRIDDQSSTLA
jgi:excisionase family DNA binding protein